METFPPSYRALQQLAKKHRIKANQSRLEIQEQLQKKWANNKQGEENENHFFENAPSQKISETDGSSPEASHQGNTTTPETSPDSRPTENVLSPRGFVSSISASACKALSMISSPPKSLASPSRRLREEERPSFVQDLNDRFGNENFRSVMDRCDSEDDKSSGDSNSGDTDDYCVEEVSAGDDIEDNNVAEITSGMNNLSISVDIDGTNATKGERARDLPPLIELCFDFPPGNLGLILKKDEYGNTEVQEVKNDCPLRDYVIRGDILLQIDDSETRKLPLEDVCKIATKGCCFSRSLCFGRNVAKRQGTCTIFAEFSDRALALLTTIIFVHRPEVQISPTRNAYKCNWNPKHCSERHCNNLKTYSYQPCSSDCTRCKRKEKNYFELQRP